MSIFLERLEQEKKDLIDKSVLLNKFMKTEDFYNLSDANQYLLREQLELMLRYSSILNIRIELNQ